MLFGAMDICRGVPRDTSSTITMGLPLLFASRLFVVIWGRDGAKRAFCETPRPTCASFGVGLLLLGSGVSNWEGLTAIDEDQVWVVGAVAPPRAVRDEVR